MEKVYEELEEAKAEIQRLECNIDNRESVSSTTNDAQQIDPNEKLKKLEEDNKQLLSVEETNEGGGEKEAKSSKEGICEKDGLIQELDVKQKKIEDELKWKSEQYKHLEEAHQKLQDQFHDSKIEWEAEKSSLIEQVSEMKSLLERKSKIAECSSVQIGEEEEEKEKDLRHSLRVKEMAYKDMEYKANKLEKENQELLTSIKELKEYHIKKATATPQASWGKLRNKLKSLEQTHKACSANLKAKEDEWSSKAQKMSRELYRCNSCLKDKDQVIEELKKELEMCNFSLTQFKLQNEELSVMLQLMRSENLEAGLVQQGSEKEGGKIAQLMEQLEIKNSSLGKAQNDLEKVQEEKLALQKELVRYKEILDDSTGNQFSLLEQELHELWDALERLSEELSEKTNEGRELEFELHTLKSLAERLNMQVEESQIIRKELEESLLEQAEIEETFRREAEEKDRRISNLEQQIMLFDQEIMIGEEASSIADTEKVSLMSMMGEDEDQLEQELLARELEEAVLAHIMEDKNYIQQIRNLQQIGASLEQSLQEDMEPTGKLGRIVQAFDNERTNIDHEGDEACTAKENVNQQHSYSTKNGESIIDERSPFRELN